MTIDFLLLIIILIGFSVIANLIVGLITTDVFKLDRIPLVTYIPIIGLIFQIFLLLLCTGKIIDDLLKDTKEVLKQIKDMK